MKPLFFLPILLFFSSCVQPQAFNGGNTEIKFDQMWVWEYENEQIPENEPGRQGEMVVYFHPDLNYWLFTFEAYGTSGEMFEWILGKPDGTYIFSVSDEFEHKFETQKIEFYTAGLDLKPAGAFKNFRDYYKNFPEIKSEKFEMDYLKTNDKTEMYLADYEADFRPLYFFNLLDCEAKLPVHFPVGLHSNQLVVEENTVSGNGKKIHYRLKDISHTEYFIVLKN